MLCDMTLIRMQQSPTDFVGGGHFRASAAFVRPAVKFPTTSRRRRASI